MAKDLEVVLEEKQEKYYKDLTAISKFSDSKKKVNTKDKDEFDSFKLITDLGFINSSVVKERNEIISKNRDFNQAVSRACESLAFIKAISDYFGEGTILVRRDDFVHIIRKYGLACGNFEDYTGIVPDKNLLEIHNAKMKLENIKIGGNCNDILKEAYKNITAIIDEVHYSINLSNYDDNKMSRSARRYLESFPIVLISSNTYSSDAEARMINHYLSDYLPEEQLEKVRWYERHELSHYGMFIVAPREKMKNSKRGIRFIQATKDPFICSLVPYGVVIYSRWGKEAEDETLRKYDNLFNRLRG